MSLTDNPDLEAARLAEIRLLAERAKSEFLANISHEIRTPLNGVMGVAAALARTGLTPQQHEMVVLIETSARALETILSDVLDFSRIEAGRLELRPRSFDLEACLRAAATLFEATAGEKGLGFRLEVSPLAQGAFEGDPGRIRQIACNLLSNAVKFTDAGEVSLRAEATDEGDRARVTISVADTGIGFDEAAKARLFERFEQADGSITRRFGGSGLGLAISRSLADAMGGELTAVSRPGKGSIFTLSLPLTRGAPPHAMPPTAELRSLKRTPRVLLAEDHAVNRRVVELIFGAAGVEPICVENGVQAVETARSAAFDLILMDLQMPEMDGLTAIRAIRAEEREGRRPRTPIWCLSANALPEHIAASHAAGADGHLAKPVSSQQLFAVLAKACATEAAQVRALRA
jgi:CheY-like chemotaxis protein/nitrogen-specific signal transduction histidine kinase